MRRCAIGRRPYSACLSVVYDILVLMLSVQEYSFVPSPGYYPWWGRRASKSCERFNPLSYSAGVRLREPSFPHSQGLTHDNAYPAGRRQHRYGVLLSRIKDKQIFFAHHRDIDDRRPVGLET